MKQLTLSLMLLFTMAFSEPTKDSLFLELDKKELNEMSANECSYYLNHKLAYETQEKSVKREKTKVGLLIATTALTTALTSFAVIDRFQEN